MSDEDTFELSSSSSESSAGASRTPSPDRTADDVTTSPKTETLDAAAAAAAEALTQQSAAAAAAVACDVQQALSPQRPTPPSSSASTRSATPTPASSRSSSKASAASCPRKTSGDPTASPPGARSPQSSRSSSPSPRTSQDTPATSPKSSRASSADSRRSSSKSSHSDRSSSTASRRSSNSSVSASSEGEAAQWAKAQQEAEEAGAAEERRRAQEQRVTAARHRDRDKAIAKESASRKADEDSRRAAAQERLEESRKRRRAIDKKQRAAAAAASPPPREFSSVPRPTKRPSSAPAHRAPRPQRPGPHAVSGQWRPPTSTSPDAMAHHQMCVVGDNAFVIGGVGRAPRRLQAFNSATGHWKHLSTAGDAPEGMSSKAGPPTLRGHTATVFRNTVVVVGGTSPTPGLWSLDTVTMVWTAAKGGTLAARDPCVTRHHAATALGAFLCVVGGYKGPRHGTTPTVDRFDTASGEWVVDEGAGDAALALQHHSADYIARVHRIVVFGGATAAGDLSNQLVVYNPDTHATSTPVTIGHCAARTHHTTAVVSSTLFVASGKGAADECLGDLFALDLDTFTWREVSLNGVPYVPRFAAQIVALGQSDQEQPQQAHGVPSCRLVIAGGLTMSAGTTFHLRPRAASDVWLLAVGGAAPPAPAPAPPAESRSPAPIAAARRPASVAGRADVLQREAMLIAYRRFSQWSLDRSFPAPLPVARTRPLPDDGDDEVLPNGLHASTMRRLVPSHDDRRRKVEQLRGELAAAREKDMAEERKTTGLKPPKAHVPALDEGGVEQLGARLYTREVQRRAEHMAGLREKYTAVPKRRVLNVDEEEAQAMRMHDRGVARQEDALRRGMERHGFRPKPAARVKSTHEFAQRFYTKARANAQSHRETAQRKYLSPPPCAHIDDDGVRQLVNRLADGS